MYISQTAVGFVLRGNLKAREQWLGSLQIIVNGVDFRDVIFSHDDLAFPSNSNGIKSRALDNAPPFCSL